MQNWGPNKVQKSREEKGIYTLSQRIREVAPLKED